MSNNPVDPKRSRKWIKGTTLDYKKIRYELSSLKAEFPNKYPNLEKLLDQYEKIPWEF